MTPLTEHEKQVLADIEQDFNLGDPTLSAGLREVRSHHVRRVWECCALFLAGIMLLLAGVITTLVPIGVIGFHPDAPRCDGSDPRCSHPGRGT